MGTSLKDALLKVGLRATKKENERKFIPKKEKTKTSMHQEYHDFCDACMKGAPDVEFYKHNNRLLDAQWMCVACADKNSISDDCRKTQQSEYSRKGIFKREFGHTNKKIGQESFRSSRR